MSSEECPIVIDGHLDLAPSALYMGRDLTKSAYENRHHEESIEISDENLQAQGWGKGSVAFPDMIKGRIALSFANIISHVGRSYSVSFAPTYRSSQNAFAAAVGQLAYYQLMESNGELNIVTSAPELRAHVDSWDNSQQHDDKPPLGIVLSMEGADPILSPDNLTYWWNKGLRSIMLAHYGISRYSHGTGRKGGVATFW